MPKPIYEDLFHINTKTPCQDDSCKTRYLEMKLYQNGTLELNFENQKIQIPSTQEKRFFSHLYQTTEKGRLEEVANNIPNQIAQKIFQQKIKPYLT